MASTKKPESLSRRRVIKNGCKGCILLLSGMLSGAAIKSLKKDHYVWQVDQKLCNGCGKCATDCVLRESAAKAIMDNTICPFRFDCPAFYRSIRKKKNLDRLGNHRCPTGALLRREVKGGFFHYSIDAKKCIGCGDCTYLCHKSCNGALKLIIQYDRCVHCNECNIAVVCPQKAISRIKI